MDCSFCSVAMTSAPAGVPAGTDELLALGLLCCPGGGGGPRLASALGPLCWPGGGRGGLRFASGLGLPGCAGGPGGAAAGAGLGCPAGDGGLKGRNELLLAVAAGMKDGWLLEPSGAAGGGSLRDGGGRFGLLFIVTAGTSPPNPGGMPALFAELPVPSSPGGRPELFAELTAKGEFMPAALLDALLDAFDVACPSISPGTVLAPPGGGKGIPLFVMDWPQPLPLYASPLPSRTSLFP
mmetsp:Transcript_43265/g.81221  ORF Transcript_43265/g.81221 Transcript_43265/m.81221 type:complete len:238 (-) Transcript_43265:168-881(-)